MTADDHIPPRHSMNRALVGSLGLGLVFVTILLWTIGVPPILAVTLFSFTLAIPLILARAWPAHAGSHPLRRIVMAALLLGVASLVMGRLISGAISMYVWPPACYYVGTDDPAGWGYCTDMAMPSWLAIVPPLIWLASMAVYVVSSEGPASSSRSSGALVKSSRVRLTSDRFSRSLPNDPFVDRE